MQKCFYNFLANIVNFVYTRCSKNCNIIVISILYRNFGTKDY